VIGYGETRNRTEDTTIFSRVLYQLSYLAVRGDASESDCPPKGGSSRRALFTRRCERNNRVRMTSRQLFVLRHAKSSWDNPGLDDHERPLAPRGRRAVEVIAEHFRTNGIEPAVVLCSSSRRTRETLEGIDPGGRHLIEPELYAASTGTIIERLNRIPDDVGSVLLIGHNPAVQTLVLRLATGDAGSDLSEVQRKFPTAALATLTFECAWSELGPGRARLVAFVRPKHLSLS
jgi:phosphohistidine phosphatase